MELKRNLKKETDKDYWFPASQNGSHNEEWFSQLPAENTPKWKIILSLVDEIIILVLIIFTVYWVYSHFS